jgi:serine/threonine kinase 33
VHRDLKLENILLKEFDPEQDIYYIKVTDFGLSSQRATTGTESMFEDYCGTPLYMGKNNKRRAPLLSQRLNLQKCLYI